MARFYLPQDLAEQELVELPISISRHIQVLRLQPSQEVTLFNGYGGEFSAEILTIGRKTVQVKIKQHLTIERELKLNLHLYASCINSDRMDWLIEKATELGVTSIQPLQSKNSAFKFKAEQSHKKLQHWQAQSIAAAEQSGRNRLPNIEPIKTLTQITSHLAHLAQQADSQVLLLSFLQPNNTLSKLLATKPSATNWIIVCGPEGGFSLEEEQSLLNLGCQAVSLTPTILRAETAAIAATSLIASSANLFLEIS